MSGKKAAFERYVRSVDGDMEDIEKALVECEKHWSSGGEGKEVAEKEEE